MRRPQRAMETGAGAAVNGDKAMEKKRTIVGHPSLLEWLPPRVHCFSPAQLESLTAICDAVIPSLPPPFQDGVNPDLTRGVTAADVTRFYNRKASDEGVIDVVRPLYFTLHCKYCT